MAGLKESTDLESARRLVVKSLARAAPYGETLAFAAIAKILEEYEY